MDLKLAGKSVLVTGASRGLGFAVAHLFALEGAKIAINGRNSQSLNTASQNIFKDTGITPVCIPGDLTDPYTPPVIIERTIQELGALDILIANAGGPPPGSFESFDDLAWQKAIDLCFLSQVRLIRSALPELKKSKNASVLTITSYSVKQPIQNLILSNSIRSATVGLTKTLALELGHLGIRFNSILPGWTETERVTELITSRTKLNGTSYEKKNFKNKQKIRPLEG